MRGIDIVFLCIFLISYYRLKRHIDLLRDDISWLGQERVRIISANREIHDEYQSQINQLKENITLQKQRTDLLVGTIGNVGKKIDKIKDAIS